MSIEPTRASRLAGAWLLAAALAACGATPPPQPAARVDGLDTLVVAAGDAGTSRAWDGVVEAVREATLSAQTHGRVAEVLHDVDDRVAQGDLLVQLSTVEQQSGVDAARARLRAAEAAATEAEANLRRHRELAQRHHVSKAQLDQVRMASDSALAARDAALAALAEAIQQSDYTAIRAPYAGIVARRHVEAGESVVPGQALVTVFSPDALRIEVDIPQAEADRVRAHPFARVTLADARSVEVADVTVYPSADPVTHAVAVRVHLPAPETARPGSTAKVAFPGLEGTAYPQVPASALVRRGEIHAVYVLAAGRLTLRQLRPGRRIGDHVQVIAGLRAGETIAADPVAAAQALAAARAGR